MTIEFFMPMEKVPTKTHQQKRAKCINGKPVFYEDSELSAVRAKIMSHLSKHSPETKLNGPVRLIVKWCFKCTSNHINGQYKDTRPDTDNLNKLLKDCMTDCNFWNDDAQVASEIIEKFWADLPGIYICISELGAVKDEG